MMTSNVWIPDTFWHVAGHTISECRVRCCLGSLGGEYGLSELDVIHSSGLLQINLDP